MQHTGLIQTTKMTQLVIYLNSLDNLPYATEEVKCYSTKPKIFGRRSERIVGCTT